MLRIENVSAAYGGIGALYDLSLDVPPKQITTLVGSNGAGKTTLTKVILGLKAPQSGRILLNGQDMTGETTSKIVGAGVTLVPEGRELFPAMTVRENLQLGATVVASKGQRRTNMERVTDLFPVLGKKLASHARDLSGGEQQMLAIGRALMGSPDYLVLDEPSIGLAPLIEEHLMDSIRTVSNELGIGVLLIEQNAMLALEFSDTAYVIDLGRIVTSAPSADLLDDPKIVEAYLGG